MRATAPAPCTCWRDDDPVLVVRTVRNPACPIHAFTDGLVGLTEGAAMMLCAAAGFEFMVISRDPPGVPYGRPDNFDTERMGVVIKDGRVLSATWG